MKKIWCILLLFSILGILYEVDLDVLAADTSYLTYNEIIMVDGKLLANFTEKEYEDYYSQVSKPIFWGKCGGYLYFTNYI